MGLSILGGEDGKGIYLLLLRHCSENQTLDERTMVYYDETIQTSVKRILPLHPISLEELPLQEFSHIWEMQFQI